MRGARFLIALVAIALLLAAWLSWHSEDTAAPQPSAPPAVPQSTDVPPVAADDAASPTQTPAAVTTTAPQRVESPPPDGAEPTNTPAPTTATVRGRCVDLHHRPLPGCDVRAIGAPAAAMPRTISSADGSFAFTLDMTGDALVAAVKAELRGAVPVTHRIAELVAGRDCDLGDFVVVLGTAVRGRIVDPTGQPFPGAGVTFVDATVRDGVERLGQVMAQADGDGRFATRLASGTWEVKSVLQRLSADRVEIGEEEVELEVTLAPPRVLHAITGTVVDAEGNALQAQLLRAPEPGGSSDAFPLAASDRDGTFALTSRYGGQPIALIVQADGYQPWHSPQPIPFGTANLRVVLTAAAPAVLSLRRPDGTPVTDARVYVWRSVPFPGRVVAGPFANGVVALGPLLAGECSVLVDPVEGKLGCTERLPLRFEAGGNTPITVPWAATRTLAVRAPDEVGMAGTHFELLDAPPSHLSDHGVPRAAWLEHGARPRILQEGTTDPRGEARLSGPGGRALWLVLRGAHPAVLVENVRLDEPTPLRVHVGAGAALRVHVGPAAALQRYFELTDLEPRADPGRFQLFLHRVGSARRHEDQTLTFDASASCGGEELAAGTWELTLYFDHRKLRQLTPVVLNGGEQRRLEVDLQPLLPALLHGGLRVDGEQVVGAEVALRGDGDTTPAHQPSARSDHDGRYRIVAPADRYTVVITPPGGCLPIAGGEVMLSAGGELQRDLAVRTAPLRLRVVDAAGRPAAGVVLYLGKGGDGCLLPATDVGGRTAIRGGVSGRFAVRAGLAGRPFGEVDAAIAAEQTVTLPAGR